MKTEDMKFYLGRALLRFSLVLEEGPLVWRAKFDGRNFDVVDLEEDGAELTVTGEDGSTDRFGTFRDAVEEAYAEAEHIFKRNGAKNMTKEECEAVIMTMAGDIGDLLRRIDELEDQVAKQRQEFEAERLGWLDER